MKDIIVNSLIKTLSVIKHKYFIGMIEIKDKRKLLASIKQEDNFRDAF